MWRINHTGRVHLHASFSSAPAIPACQALHLLQRSGTGYLLHHLPTHIGMFAVRLVHCVTFDMLSLAKPGQSMCRFCQQHQLISLRLSHRRTHQSLASVGVAALVRLVTSAGTQMSSSIWQETVDMVAQAAAHTVPQVAELVSPPPGYLAHAPLQLYHAYIQQV